MANKTSGRDQRDNLRDPLPLNERLERIGQHIVRARLFLDLWFYFEEHESKQKIIDTMCRYNEFFRFTPHAYLTTYVIYISGVFDKRGDTVSFKRLVQDIEKIGSLNPQSTEDVKMLLAEAEPIVKKVGTLRNKAFAHRSAHISYNDVFKIAAVKPNELRNLTDVALKAANRLLSACSLPRQHFTTLPREAAEDIMKALAATAR